MISAATISRFRKILGEEGYNIILEALIESGIKTGVLKKKDLESVIVDTTVQLKKKLLIVSTRYPYPLEKGDKLRLFYQIKYIHQKYILFNILFVEVY